MLDGVRATRHLSAMAHRFRRTVHLQLDARAWNREGGHAGLSPVNKLLAAAILLVTAVSIARTEPALAAGRGALFDRVELGFGLLFAVELGLRMWAAGEEARYRGVAGRARFLMTPGVALDLFVVAVSLAPMVAGQLLPFRLLRLAAIARVATLGRLSPATRHLLAAVAERRHELAFTVVLALVAIVLGATAMWLVEGQVQPDKFGSIPRAMWWSAVTLMTIGYGDVYPVTVGGRVLAVALAMVGVGLIALPAGIMAAAFSDGLARVRRKEDQAAGSPPAER